MTARRAIPEPPTALQRFAALVIRGPSHDRLVSALEDHADRLDGRARQHGPTNLYGQTCAEFAADLRRILQEHS